MKKVLAAIGLAILAIITKFFMELISA